MKTRPFACFPLDLSPAGFDFSLQLSKRRETVLKFGDSLLPLFVSFSFPLEVIPSSPFSLTENVLLPSWRNRSAGPSGFPLPKARDCRFSPWAKPPLCAHLLLKYLIEFVQGIFRRRIKIWSFLLLAVREIVSCPLFSVCHFHVIRKLIPLFWLNDEEETGFPAVVQFASEVYP